MCQANNNKPRSYYAKLIARYKALEQRSGRLEAEASTTQLKTNDGRGAQCAQELNPSAFTKVKRPKKKVTFKPSAKVRIYAPTHNSKHVAMEKKSRLYYSKEELQVFDLEAQAICTLSQELPDIRNSGALIVGVSDNCTIDSLRGLELIMFPERKQNKLRVTESLLKYQEILNSIPNMDSEQKHKALAAASAKFSLWASNKARDTAYLDSMRAFEAEYLIPIDVPQPMFADSPITCHRKRFKVSSDEEDGNDPQQKRRKIAC